MELDFLHFAACLIQKRWRGFQQRKAFQELVRMHAHAQ